MRCFVNGILCDKYEEYGGFSRISNPELGVNFLKPNGELLSNEWYMNANDFHCGFAVVQLAENIWNYLKTDGSLLNNEEYVEAWNFENGLALVAIGETKEQALWNFLKTDETYLYQEWFKKVKRLLGIPVWKVQCQDEKWNFATIDGKIICKEWYRDVRELVYSVLQVQKDDGNWYTLNENGEITD